MGPFVLCSVDGKSVSAVTSRYYELVAKRQVGVFVKSNALQSAAPKDLKNQLIRSRRPSGRQQNVRASRRGGSGGSGMRNALFVKNKLHIERRLLEDLGVNGIMHK